MITNIECIRNVRPVAQNIDGINRLEPYLREAELLNIMPQIGADIYRWLDETDFESSSGPWIYIPFEGAPVEVSKEMHDELLFGGYYSAGCNSGYSMGLVAAVSYYAYSRAVMENQVNVTSFGVVRKRSEFSDPVDASTLIQVSREAKKLGDEATRQVVEHFKATGLIPCCHRAKRVLRFMAIDKTEKEV